MKSLFYEKHYVSRADEGIVIGEETTAAPCLVDVKGYIPMAKQIEKQIFAGERLEAFRRGDFDVDANYTGEFIEPSPINSPYFYPGDMKTVAEEIIQRQQEVSREVSEAESEEKPKSVATSEDSERAAE